MLSKEEVVKIAKLARLELTPEESEFYQAKLSRVLYYMDELKKVPTEGDNFPRHIPADSKGMREDQVNSFAHPEKLLENAPATSSNQFLLPSIME